MLITSQILNQLAESLFPYWLQKRYNRRLKKRMCSGKTGTDLSLAEQVNMEKEMGTYLVRCSTLKELKLFWAVVDRGFSQGKQEFFGFLVWQLISSFISFAGSCLCSCILSWIRKWIQCRILVTPECRGRNEQLCLELPNLVSLERSICVICPQSPRVAQRLPG